MVEIQRFYGTLLEKKPLTSSVMFLSFKVPETFTFKAGQYVMLSMVQDGERRFKSYSILNPPSKKGVIDLCVKIIDGGFASEVFKLMNVGDEVEMKGPFGHFVFDAQLGVDEHWFIGAGTGIAPLYSMIKEYLALSPTFQFKLIVGFRSSSDLLFHNELSELAFKNKNFVYVPTLSREENNLWKGARGRVQQHLGSQLQGKVFYLCGLKDLVLETKEYLLHNGVDVSHIKFERYN